MSIENLPEHLSQAMLVGTMLVGRLGVLCFMMLYCIASCRWGRYRLARFCRTAVVVVVRNPRRAQTS